MAGKLYLCATPIGNLEDMTFRAIRILQEVDLIAAEDTRNSIKLLNHFEIHTPMTSYHEYNKYDKGRELVQKLLNEHCPYHRCRNTGNLRPGGGAGENGIRSRNRSDESAGGVCVCNGTDAVGTFDEKICV